MERGRERDSEGVKDERESERGSESEQERKRE